MSYRFQDIFCTQNTKFFRRSFWCGVFLQMPGHGRYCLAAPGSMAEHSDFFHVSNGDRNCMKWLFLLGIEPI